MGNNSPTYILLTAPFRQLLVSQVLHPHLPARFSILEQRMSLSAQAIPEAAWTCGRGSITVSSLLATLFMLVPDNTSQGDLCSKSCAVASPHRAREHRAGHDLEASPGGHPSPPSPQAFSAAISRTGLLNPHFSLASAQ